MQITDNTYTMHVNYRHIDMCIHIFKDTHIIWIHIALELTLLNIDCI